MRRREFILSSAAITWPLAARAQQATTPLIGFLSSRSPNESEALVAAFRQGLAEAGYAEGQNVHLAFRWAEGRYDRLPELAAELVKSQVAVIASVGGSVSALAAKSMGLGLALSRMIVEFHGGRIIAQSDPGSGARFQIVLPIKMTPETAT